jgi:hypothetical protein
VAAGLILIMRSLQKIDDDISAMLKDIQGIKLSTKNIKGSPTIIGGASNWLNLNANIDALDLYRKLDVDNNIGDAIDVFAATLPSLYAPLAHGVTAGKIGYANTTTSWANSLLSNDVAGTVTVGEGTGVKSELKVAGTTVTGYSLIEANAYGEGDYIKLYCYGVGYSGATQCGLTAATLATINANSPVALLIQNSGEGPIVFGTKNVERARITATGLSTVLQITSTYPTLSGSPFAITSTVVNTNLNADLLDGQHGAYYAPVVHGVSQYYLPVAATTSSWANSLLQQNAAGTMVGVGCSPATLFDTQKDQNASSTIRIRNDTNGTAAQSALVVCYGNYAGNAILETLSPLFTASGLHVGSSACLRSSGNTSGLRIYTEDATSLILGTNNTARLTIDNAGTADFSGKLTVDHVGQHGTGGVIFDNNIVTSKRIMSEDVNYSGLQIRSVTLADDASTTITGAGALFDGTVDGFLRIITRNFEQGKGEVLLHNTTASIVYNPFGDLATTDTDTKLCIIRNVDATTTLKNRLGAEMTFNMFLFADF